MAQPLDPIQRSPQLQRLRRAAIEDRLPPSLLLVGPEGSGKEAAALQLASFVLGGRSAGIGEAEDQGLDRSCTRRVLRMGHPDLYYVFPATSSLTGEEYRAILDEKAREPLARVRQPSSAIIPIGDADDPGLVSVRAIRRFVQAEPFEGRRRVVIVADAHRMNRSAANALLKTLEEPPPAALLLLCTSQPHLLPQTVRSRCSRIHIRALGEEELAAHLQAVHGIAAPEAARIASVAGGNARRAFDLLDPTARRLADWASELLEIMVGGRREDVAPAAERISKGQAPGGGSKKLSADSSLSANRDIGMRVLDFLVADLLALARLAGGAHVDGEHRQRLEPLGTLPAPAVTAMARELLAARSDLSRNVNVGLVLLHSLLRATDLAARARVERHAAGGS